MGKALYDIDLISILIKTFIYSWSCLHFACYNSDVSVAILKPIVKAMTSNSKEKIDLLHLFDERSNVIHLAMMQQNYKNMNEVKNVIAFLLRSFDIRQSDMFIWDRKYSNLSKKIQNDSAENIWEFFICDMGKYEFADFFHVFLVLKIFKISFDFSEFCTLSVLSS